MRKVDLAYVAGIVDGEGWIGLRISNRVRGKIAYTLAVSVANSNEWIIQWLKFAFGGNCCCAEFPEDNRKASWQWSIVANDALKFLDLIYPYLKLKRTQADIAIKFQRERRGRGTRTSDKELALQEAQRILITNMNKKGKGTSY